MSNNIVNVYQACSIVYSTNETRETIKYVFYVRGTRSIQLWTFAPPQLGRVIYVEVVHIYF